jgi:YYY domain-containing protein
LIGAATLIASGTSTGWRLPWVSLRDTAIFGAIVYVTGQVLLFPYLSRYGSLPSQLEPAGETTRIADYVTVNGLMLFAIGGFLLVELWTLTKALRQYGIAGWFTIAMMLLVGVCGLAIALATDLTSILIVLVIAAIGLCALNRHLSPVLLFTFAIIALALGLTLFPERFRLANDVGRMNTVFKFCLHAWILLGVGATIAIAQVFTRTPPATWSAPEAKTEQEAQVTHTGWGGWIASRAWLAGLAFLVLAASMYPALATGLRLDDRFNDIPPTLDGLAFMDEAVQAEGAENQPAVRFTLAGDHAAITWLQDNVQGTPVILEAVQPQYHWAGRVSVQTGLPAVLGWEWHETQQRPGYESWIQQRKTDVAYMYSADAPFSAIQPLLDKYKVRLIYVGDLERAIYPEIGLAKFAQAADQGLLTIVYQSESTVIYAYPAETEAGTS